MSDHAYLDLEQALAAYGINCQFQTPGQLVITRQVGPIWPDRGNSFWVTHTSGNWYIFTWAPVGYRLAESANIVESCRAFMAFADRTVCVVPDAIIEAFGLTELSDAEAEAVYREMPAV